MPQHVQDNATSPGSHLFNTLMAFICYFIFFRMRLCICLCVPVSVQVRLCQLVYLLCGIIYVYAINYMYVVVWAESGTVFGLNMWTVVMQKHSFVLCPSLHRCTWFSWVGWKLKQCTKANRKKDFWANWSPCVPFLCLNLHLKTEMKTSFASGRLVGHKC